MKKRHRSRAALTLLFSAIVFAIFFITMVIMTGAAYFLSRAGVLTRMGEFNRVLPLLALGLVSVLTGTVVAAMVSSVPLNPVRKLIAGMNRLAGGDYKARLELGKHPVTREISESFNLLAEELQNTEILRSDFVNNFSHEFKTPIVSIRGFAKLMQKGDITGEQREFLEIIAEESERLSAMASSVLNLAKVENQIILTDVTSFNLSEQIRDCVLLLESKWAAKGLNIQADFGEHQIRANEDLLKQVWINIIDNAVKFAPESGEIAIGITRTGGMVTVSIRNNGPEIGAEDIKRVFNKYWQGDASHASEGTGIGLPLAKRITELHRGSITVTSTPKETAFTVHLPNG